MIDCFLNVNNSVQGVQGVQGQFWPTLHSYMPRAAWLCVVLCRVCRVNLRACARGVYTTTPHVTQTRLARICTLHTLHTLHRSRYSWLTAVQGIFITLHTLHLLFLIKKI